jgi:hypothetical protein
VCGKACISDIELTLPDVLETAFRALDARVHLLFKLARKERRMEVNRLDRHMSWHVQDASGQAGRLDGNSRNRLDWRVSQHAFRLLLVS